MGKSLVIASTLVIVAIVLAGAADARPAGKSQRIAITFHSQSGTFALTPLSLGPLRRDSGTYTSCCWTRRVFTRDGESTEIDTPTVAFQSKRGRFIWHERITFVDIDKDYTVATASWRISHGTGAYAHLTGHGREASVGRGEREVAAVAEGLVRLRR